MTDGINKISIESIILIAAVGIMFKNPKMQEVLIMRFKEIFRNFNN